MPTNDTVMYADYETFEALDQIRSNFNQEWSSNATFRYHSGKEVPVKVIHNIAYYFNNHGTPDARCVIIFIQPLANATAPEGQAQLLYLEQQKRGQPHVHIEEVHIWDQRLLSCDEVHELINQTWEP